MITVKTNNQIAIDSADHQHPLGCVADNNSNLSYIDEVKKYFQNKQLNVLDLGCSGGQIIMDHLQLGDFAMGLEGSSNVLNGAGKQNWDQYHNKNLFLCDITEPFECLNNEVKVVFDCIQMWEVLEHIPYAKLPQLFKNITSHLKQDGLFIGSIATCEDPPRHVSIFPKHIWQEIFKQNGLDMVDYMFTYFPRSVHSGVNGFVFCAKKLKTNE